MQPHMALTVHSRELAEVEAVLEQSIAAGNPLIASEYGNQISRTVVAKGVALAGLLHGLRSNWKLFQLAGIEEEWGDFINAHMHISSRVAEKYADMFEQVLDNGNIPIDLRERLAEKPIKELLLLTAAVREGDLTNSDLEDVVVLNYGGIRDRVRERRGDATNSHTRVYARLVRRQESKWPLGSLVVFSGDESEAIGHIKIEPNTEAGKKFLARMINTLELDDIR